MASTGGLVGIAHRDGMGRDSSLEHPPDIYTRSIHSIKKIVLTIGGGGGNHTNKGFRGVGPGHPLLIHIKFFLIDLGLKWTHSETGTRKLLQK